MPDYAAISADDVQRLRSLITELLHTRALSVNALAKAAGVGQPLARRAFRGEVKVMTPNLSRLQLYVHIELGLTEDDDLQSLNQAVRSFTSAGGTVAELLRIIRAHTSLLPRGNR